MQVMFGSKVIFESKNEVVDFVNNLQEKHSTSTGSEGTKMLYLGKNKCGFVNGDDEELYKAYLYNAKGDSEKMEIFEKAFMKDAPVVNLDIIG